MRPLQTNWEYIRKVVATADSSGLLTTTNSNWEERETQSRGRDIPSGAEAVLISVIGNHASDPDDKTCTIKFSMYRAGGVAQTVGTYVFTIGDLRCINKPRAASASLAALSKWAESISETSNNWIDQPSIECAEADGAAMLKINTYGAAYITAEITSVGAATTFDVLMTPVHKLPVARQDEIKMVVFPTLTWAPGGGHAALTSIVENVNMLVERVIVVISSGGVANPTTTLTFADDTGAVVIDGTNFATLADATTHQKLSTKATADFDAVPVAGKVTITIDPSAAPTAGSTLTVQVIFFGP